MKNWKTKRRNKRIIEIAKQLTPNQLEKLTALCIAYEQAPEVMQKYIEIKTKK